ncbi:hypothetical protein AcetOrient_orf01951 [Acetobacter orientalis]|uniref:Uncharacterized protein n=1 Tax=Acetobacter orientalis TaxID=146474 RepID=A0A2Z5ZH50_9PROT|nr:hypothetical protein AcetOrient_orf01951 [Acetobacter orientalis]
MMAAAQQAEYMPVGVSRAYHACTYGCRQRCFCAKGQCFTNL